MKKFQKFGRRYPWRRWFCRPSFTLVRGKDYDCMTHAMVQMVRNAAAPGRHNVVVSVRVHEDQGGLTVTVLRGAVA